MSRPRPKDNAPRVRKTGIKMIFIDRDGVINKDPGGWTRCSYVTDWSDFHFLPGAIEALKMLDKNGIGVILVSNQAGVGKGYFTREQLDKVNRKMVDEISRHGGRIQETYYCIHRDEDNCDCRKPKTAFFEKAAKKYGIDLNTTYFIGDSKVDIIAGNAVGCRTVFVLSGKTSLEEMRKCSDKPDYIFNDLLEAVKWLVGKEQRRNKRRLRRTG